MQLAGDAWPDLDEALHSEMKMLPLTSLEGTWGTFSAEESIVAYLEANSATHYLIERWGMARVDDLVKSFQLKATVATAFQDKLFISFEQFHRQWLGRFEQARP
jgi:hypothetical protein